MINPASSANQTGLSMKLRRELIDVFFDYMDALIILKESTQDLGFDERRRLEILSKREPFRAFVDYMEKLIQMKVKEAGGLDSTSLLPENPIAENCGQILLEQLRNIINAKLPQMGGGKPPNGKKMLDIISAATSKISDDINEQLDSLVAARKERNQDFRIMTPPRMEEKEKSKIRTELIKIFQIDTEILTKILEKVNAAISRKALDKQILEDHEEEIWRAISLIKSKPDDPLHYLKDFKLAMETLPSDLRSKLVPIIYEKPPHSILSYINQSNIDGYRNNSTLKFGPRCDLSGYYLRDIIFSCDDSCDDWEAQLDFKSANMSHADLSGSDFRNLALNKADLTEANLTRTDFIGSKLIGTKLSGAYWEQGQPPLIDRRTRFIPDDLRNEVGRMPSLQ